MSFCSRLPLIAVVAALGCGGDGASPADGDAAPSESGAPVGDAATTCSLPPKAVATVACGGMTQALPFAVRMFTFYRDAACGLMLAVQAPESDSVGCSGGATSTFVGGEVGWLVRGIPHDVSVGCVRRVAAADGSVGPGSFRVDLKYNASSGDVTLVGCTSVG